MRGIIAALSEKRNPFSILTKGTLILRDVDLLRAASTHAAVSASFSIGTVDERVWRETEPGTPHPKARLEAVRSLAQAGIPTGVLMAPVLPGLSDGPDQLRAVVEAALEAGATHVSPILLHLRPGVREEFLPWLERHHPELIPRYLELYPRAYAPKPERDRLGRRVDAIVRAARRRWPERPPGDASATPRFRRSSGRNDRSAERAGDRDAHQPTLW